ncbi:MAG: hypothetical protein HPY55_13900 [Firmicutes bacterium]|nr:hypothetical protein [Bacillota bacterium]
MNLRVRGSARFALVMALACAVAGGAVGGCGPRPRQIDLARVDGEPARVAGRLDLPPGFVASVCGFSGRGVWIQARRPGAAAARYFHVTPAILGAAPSSCEIVEVEAPPGARPETAWPGGDDFRAVVGIVDGRFVVYCATGEDEGNRAFVSCIEGDGHVAWEVEIPAGFMPGLGPDWRHVIAYGNSRDVPMLTVTPEGRCVEIPPLRISGPVKWYRSGSFVWGRMVAFDAVWDARPNGMVVTTRTCWPSEGKWETVEYAAGGNEMGDALPFRGGVVLVTVEGDAVAPVHRPFAGPAGPERSEQPEQSKAPSFRPITLDQRSQSLTAWVAGGHVLWQVYPTATVSVPEHVILIRVDGPDGNPILSGEIAARGLARLSPLGNYVCWEDHLRDFKFLRVSDGKLWTYSPDSKDPWAVETARYWWSPNESLIVLTETGQGDGGSVVVLSTD